MSTFFACNTCAHHKAPRDDKNSLLRDHICECQEALVFNMDNLVKGTERGMPCVTMRSNPMACGADGTWYKEKD